MDKEGLLLAVVFVPLAGALLVPLAGKVSAWLRNVLALACVAAPFFFSLALLPQVLSGSSVTVYKALFLGCNFALTADMLAVFTALASSFISSVIVLYSFGYISHYENQNEYYCMVVLFLGSMMGIIYAANLIFLYLFWEMTALVSWRLIGFFRTGRDVLRADKAFLMTVGGALAMLVGFLMIYQQTGTFDYSAGVSVPTIAAMLIVCGMFAKSATFPFHTWLPDAGVAPSPVTALLHAAVLVKIGVYVFARLFVWTYAIPETVRSWVMVFAAVSAIISAGAALIETDLKRIIAYSTVSQIGFIFFGLATGNPAGIAGGVLYILMHGLAKAGLFLCAGIVEQKTHLKDITKLGGLMKTMPWTAAAFLLCAFSVIGIPPFGGFFSKYLVFMGGVQSGRYAITAVFLVGACLTMLYLIRVFKAVFLGDPGVQAREGSPVMVVSVVLLAALSLAGGILVMYPAAFVRSGVEQILVMAR